MKTPLYIIYSILIAVVFAAISCGCGRSGAVRNAREVRDFMLEQLADDTTALVRKITQKLDTLPLRNEDDCDALYSVINSATFQIHHRGDASDALRMNYGMLDILANSPHRTKADTRHMLNMYVKIGATFSEGGMQSISLDYYKRGLEIATEPEYASFRAMYFNNIGILYAEAHMYEKAMEYMKKALNINLKENNHGEISLNYANLAELYDVTDDVASAHKAVQSSLDHIDGEREPLMLANMRVQQGGLYARQEQYDVAMLRYQAALKQFEEQNCLTGMTEAYLHISEIYLHREQCDSAAAYALRALEEARVTSNHVALGKALERMSEIHMARGEYRQSVDCLKEAEALADSLRNVESQLRLRNWEVLGNRVPDQDHRPSGAAAVIWTLAAVLLAMAVAYIIYRYQKKKKTVIRSDEGNDLRLRQLSDRLGERNRRLEGELDQRNRELDQRNRELTTLSLEKMKNNEGLEQVCEELRNVLLELNPRETARRDRLRVLLGRIDALTSTNNDEEFKRFFELVHPDFYKNLSGAYPDLTPRDLRLCAFIYLGMSTKEIASFTYREVRSVESARNRLRKKLGLDVNADIAAHLRTLL